MHNEISLPRMESKMENTTFAFKLADKKANHASKWKARDGVSRAGCTEVRLGNYRESSRFGDNGVYC
jgi:hypothetical protein